MLRMKVNFVISAEELLHKGCYFLSEIESNQIPPVAGPKSKATLKARQDRCNFSGIAISSGSIRRSNLRSFVCLHTPPSISVACTRPGYGMCGSGKWAEPKSWPVGWQAMVCVQFLAQLSSTMESLAPVGRQEFQVALQGNHRRAFDFG